jgi:hypothetical protein
MVGKKSRIARNPKEKTAAEADEWINQGGTDPEIIAVKTQPTPREQTKKKTEIDEDQGKKYPHRISFDVENSQYKRLKYASFDCDRSMNDILREAVEEWMNTRNY